MSEHIPASDEVVAYPKLLQFLQVDWWNLAAHGEPDRKSGFVFAAVYKDIIRDDIIACREIEQVSGIADESCHRVAQFKWPKFL